jgi:hypothetical protein
LKSRSSMSLVVVAMLFGCAGTFGAGAQNTTPSGPGAAANDSGLGGAIEQKLILTPAQRTAIYDQVSKDKSKVAPTNFSPVIGADVPPMIELYSLPDDAVTDVPAAKMYKYTMVGGKVVLVDPTKMRIVDVIGPPPSH